MENSHATAIRKTLENQHFRKATEHLLGICHGIASDQQLSDGEIHFLSAWLKQHPEILADWPGKTLARRVHEILQDNIITDDERDDLLITLNSLCGNSFSETGDPTVSTSTLPFDDDPHIIFNERRFCFTGGFFFGTRRLCEKATEDAGGFATGSVTKKLDYLIVGGLPNANWIASSFGTKIEKTLKYIDQGEGIALISEMQWTEALARAAR